MLVRREAIDQVGVMDERFFMYAEETDWCYRFREEGWDVTFTPAGQIIHLGGQSTAKKPVAMIVQLRLSILKFIRKHSGRFAQVSARFLTALFFAVRIPIWFARVFSLRQRSEAVVKMRAYSIGIASALFGRIDL